MLKNKNNENESSSKVVESSSSDTRSSSSEDESSDVDEMEVKDQATPDSEKGGSYLLAHQIHEKWETKYPFAYYTAKQNGWLCLICSEYGDGDKYWRTQAVRLHETFFRHESCKKHINAMKNKKQLKAVLTKGSIYKQIRNANATHSESTKKRNRCIIKKFLKTTYFIARRKWAVRENFSDFIDFLCDLGDEEINQHLRECSSRATYTSKNTADEFLKILSDYLESGFKDRLVAASDFSLMTDETTDISDRAELSIFVRYVDSDVHEIKEEFRW